MTKICVFAPSEDEANRWAKSQNLDREQYFFPHSTGEIKLKSNFHVIVIGVGNLSSTEFEKAYNLALERGKLGRI
jgi:hypothetical protein